jgi:hypothetical protein
VLDPRHRPCLAAQPDLRGQDIPLSRVDPLERDLAHQIGIARAVHPAHAALAEELDHLVAVDAGAGLEPALVGEAGGHAPGRTGLA